MDVKHFREIILRVTLLAMGVTWRFTDLRSHIHMFVYGWLPKAFKTAVLV